MINTILQPFELHDENVRNKLEQFTQYENFKKGEALFLNNELTHYFYVIKQGKIKTYQLNLNNGKEQTIFILREGDMFDTVILLDETAHDVMYQAMEETVAFRIPINHVRSLIENNIEFNKKFFPYLAKQMRHLEEQTTDISLYSTEERLVKLLIQNLDPSNVMKYNIIHGLSNTEIAKLLGTVRNVVERHLKKLKQDDLLEAKNKKLKIHNAHTLLEQIKIF